MMLAHVGTHGDVVIVVAADHGVEHGEEDDGSAVPLLDWEEKGRTRTAWR
jgi:hypothetical protein